MSKPTIIFVPGFWEGSTVFEAVSEELQSYGYTTYYAPLASTGCSSPGNPNLLDDVALVRNVIEQHTNAGTEIILVCHSAGGFLGSAAVKDLVLQKRKENGMSGGVSKLVFLTAGTLPEGTRHLEILPFYEVKKNEMYCKDPINLLFNDMSASVGASWVAQLQCQPATGWADVVQYAGWKDIPSVYLVCERDCILPKEIQLQMAELAGSEVVKCNAGHMVMLSQPEKVVQIVRKAAGESL